MATRNVEVEYELTLTQEEESEINYDWLAWELLRRGVSLGDDSVLEPSQIAEACGFPSGNSVRQAIFRAIQSGKVTQDV